jgi:hypothetical protein
LKEQINSPDFRNLATHVHGMWACRLHSPYPLIVSLRGPCSVTKASKKRKLDARYTGFSWIPQKDRNMTRTFKKGDKVAWHASQGEVHGTVKEKLSSPTDIKGHHVAASPDDPQYLVESDKTGAEAAHKPEALKKRH